MRDYILCCVNGENTIDDKETTNRQHAYSCNSIYTKFRKCQENRKRRNDIHKPVMLNTGFEGANSFGFCTVIENGVHN